MNIAVNKGIAWRAHTNADREKPGPPGRLLEIPDGRFEQGPD